MESQFLISAPLKKKMDLNTSTINKTNKANQPNRSQNTNGARPRGKSFLDFGILSQHLDLRKENLELSDSDDENQY
jgi:hypothetical protein